VIAEVEALERVVLRLPQPHHFVSSCRGERESGGRETQRFHGTVPLRRIVMGRPVGPDGLTRQAPEKESTFPVSQGQGNAARGKGQLPRSTLVRDRRNVLRHLAGLHLPEPCL